MGLCETKTLKLAANNKVSSPAEAALNIEVSMLTTLLTEYCVHQ
jgi:hypothetical protein